MLYSSVPQRILGVIPARYSSSRFPGKALVSIAGKTMLQHVWERTCQARYLTDVVIATDDAAHPRRGGRFSRPRGDDPRRPRFRNRPRRRGRLGLSGADRRQHSGRRAHDRSRGHRRRDSRTARRRYGRCSHGHHQEAHRAAVRYPGSERGEGRDRCAGQRAVFLTLAHPVCTRWRAAGVLQTHRAVRLPPRLPAVLSGSAGGAAGARRAPGTAAGARKRTSRFAWWKPSTNPWASIRPKIGNRSRSCSRKHW